MDLETRLIDNKHIPYCVSIYDGIIKNSFFRTGYSNIEQMIISAIKSIANKNYDNHKIYLHNFAKFDAIFLFKILTKLGIVSPLRHKGRFISIQFNYNNYVFHFRDSFLLLPASLRKLCESFNLNIIKGYFPHLFLNNSDISLDYEGDIPNKKYFNDMSDDEYNDYCMKYNNNNWNLKNEAIKYCELDCISLYDILMKFNNIIYDKWSLNINNYPTLPSLVFAIFRAHYLKDNSVVQLSGQMYKDIKQSYTGGSVDMYIPQNDKDELVYGYDVNSLYPSMMKESLVPVSDITYFEGDIRSFNPNAYGFFYCKVKCPNNLEHPLLQSHIKTDNGLRTIAALGTYEDMVFSEEMDNCIKKGYNFDIL